MSEAELLGLASTQLGMVSVRQAHVHLSRDALRARVESGRLLPYRRAVYLVAGTPPHRFHPAMAAVLAAGPGAAVSHVAAAAVWGMRGLQLETPELVVPVTRRIRLPGVVSHRSTLLPPGHVTTWHGVRVTTPERTLLDCSAAASVSRWLLDRMTDDALRRGLTTPARLQACLDLLAGRGRRKVSVFRELVEARPPGYHPGDSDKELDVRNIIVGAGYPRPVQQLQVVVGDRVVLLDLAWPAVLLDVEYDGADHDTPAATAHDAERDGLLGSIGWTVLRVNKHWTAAGVRRHFGELYRELLPASMTCPAPDREKIAG